MYMLRLGQRSALSAVSVCRPHCSRGEREVCTLYRAPRRKLPFIFARNALSSKALFRKVEYDYTLLILS